MYQFQNYKKPDDIEDLTLEVVGVESRYKLKSCLSKKGFASGIQVFENYILCYFTITSYRRDSPLI